MSEPIRFRMRLADTVFAVSCTCPSTLERCRDYLAEDAPDHTIIISEAELAAEQAYLLSKKAPGVGLENSTPQSLELLRLCRTIAELLPSHDGFLFHGSCLALDGKGVLFTATSGTGKSTHTRLWREVFGSRVTMVNDDKPFLQVRNGKANAFGSPWRGKHYLGCNTQVPLHAICILCRGKENCIESVSPREALPMLLQQTYTPDDPVAMARTLALVQQLSKSTGLYRLYCNMDPQAAVVAMHGIFSQEETV